MATGRLNKRVTKVHSAQTWERARALYCGGMALEAVGKELGVAYATVRYHAWVEDTARWDTRARENMKQTLKE